MEVEGPADKKISKDLLRGITHQIRVLLGVRKIKVVDRGQQEAALKAIVTEEKKKSYAQCVDTACQIPLGKTLAASHILRLTISKLADVCSTSGELIDLTTEVNAGAAAVRSSCDPKALLDAADKLADVLILASQ